MTAKRAMRTTGVGWAKGYATRGANRALAISAEQRRCLVEDLAYFRAERYRNVEPGKYRDEDRRKAEADVKAALKRRRKR